MDVDTTSGFAKSGKILIGNDRFSYSEKTATSFTGVVRIDNTGTISPGTVVESFDNKTFYIHGTKALQGSQVFDIAEQLNADITHMAYYKGVKKDERLFLSGKITMPCTMPSIENLQISGSRGGAPVIGKDLVDIMQYFIDNGNHFQVKAQYITLRGRAAQKNQCYHVIDRQAASDADTLVYTLPDLDNTQYTFTYDVVGAFKIANGREIHTTGAIGDKKTKYSLALEAYDTSTKVTKVHTVIVNFVADSASSSDRKYFSLNNAISGEPIQLSFAEGGARLEDLSAAANLTPQWSPASHHSRESKRVSCWLVWTDQDTLSWTQFGKMDIRFESVLKMAMSP